MKLGSEDTSDEGLCKCFSIDKPIIDEQLSYFFFQEKGISFIIKIFLINSILIIYESL
jgi:hypothetical protein